MLGRTKVATKSVGFEVLTATSTKIAVFWNVAPCSLVDIDQHFRGAKDNIYETTRCNIPEDRHFPEGKHSLARPKRRWKDIKMLEKQDEVTTMRNLIFILLTFFKFLRYVTSSGRE
jgi:hypothetical protein